MALKAIVFDFNGTLFFDGDLQEEAWRRFFREYAGREVTYEELQEHMHGRNAAVTFNWKITSADFNIQEMQKRLAEFHSFKKYFLEDFYPLTGYGDTTRDDIWLAYQLDRPSDSTGMVVAFRRRDNKQEEIVVKMKNLDPEKTYVLEDQDTFDKMEKTGLELSEGLVLSLPQPRSSLCFTYKVKE